MLQLGKGAPRGGQLFPRVGQTRLECRDHAPCVGPRPTTGRSSFTLLLSSSRYCALDEPLQIIQPFFLRFQLVLQTLGFRLDRVSFSPGCFQLGCQGHLGRFFLLKLLSQPVQSLRGPCPCILCLVLGPLNVKPERVDLCLRRVTLRHNLFHLRLQAHQPRAQRAHLGVSGSQLRRRRRLDLSQLGLEALQLCRHLFHPCGVKVAFAAQLGPERNDFGLGHHHVCFQRCCCCCCCGWGHLAILSFLVTLLSSVLSFLSVLLSVSVSVFSSLLAIHPGTALLLFLLSSLLGLDGSQTLPSQRRSRRAQRFEICRTHGRRHLDRRRVLVCARRRQRLSVFGSIVAAHPAGPQVSCRRSHKRLVGRHLASSSGRRL